MKITALLLVIISVGFRFYDLENKLVWHDEALTIARSLGFQHGEILYGVYNDTMQTAEQILRFQRSVPEHNFVDAWQAILEHPEHSPLYYVTAAAVTQFMREIPILAARGLAVIFSLLIFPAIFWLAWEWSRNKSVAWIALALAATSPLHLLYAQEARQYSLLMALIAAASAALLRALRHQRRQDWITYCVLLTFGLYTHLLFVQIFLAHGIYLAWLAWFYPDKNTWRNIWRSGLVFAIAIIAFSPWLWLIISNLDKFNDYTNWMKNILTLSFLAKTWRGNINRTFVDFPAIEPWWTVGLGIILFTLWLGLRRASPTMIWLLICFAIPPLLISVLPDVLYGGMRSKEARYLLQLLMGLEIGIAWSLAQFMLTTNYPRYVIGVINYGIILGLGIWSQIAISQSDTWWSKALSEDNAGLARVINDTKNALILGGLKSIFAGGAGEFISISHKLKPTTPMLAQRSDETGDIPASYTKIFVLMPSSKILTRLRSQNYEIKGYNWKWVIATHKSDAATTKAAASEPIFYDHFDGGMMDVKAWQIPTRRSHDDGTQIGRTRFRCTQDYPFLPPIKDSDALISVDTYSPLGGNAFYGTDLISNQSFFVGTGLSIKVRAKVNPPAQPGTVAGIFLFARKSDIDTLHDEIDFELLGNQPNKISTNIYSNEPLGDGHPMSYPHPTGSITDYHVYEIQWLPNKVTWLIDDIVVRTNTDNIPTGAMQLHFNMWVPYKTWKEAHSFSLQPTSLPKDNRVYTLNVDWVKIHRLNSALLQ
jgi:uncharacterized membrane protein